MEKYFFDTMTSDPDDRVDAKVKVTGSAKFAAEYDFPGLLYGVIVTSTIAKGSISNIDSRSAERAPGVQAVITYQNRPAVPAWDEKKEDADQRVPGHEFRPYYGKQIYFNGQPVALVIADTLERAQYAVSLVKIEYNKETPETDMQSILSKAVEPRQNAKYERGSQAAYDDAPVKISAEYILHPHVHNPMEPHAAIAVWDGPDKLTFYNKAQYVDGTQDTLVKTFGLKKENVRVVSKFVGGAFGGASRAWPHEMSAVIGAKKMNKPVKVVLSRDDLFTMVGHRPEAIQNLKLSATADGKLMSMSNDAFGHTSSYEQFSENITGSTRLLYDCENVRTSYKLVPVDVGTPTFTRGPGETTGVFALETAMDELAAALQMDPIELRMKNYAAMDPEKKLPWSGKHLDECYQKGAESIGWKDRNPVPGSIKKGDWLIGIGMSSAVYPARRSAATVRAVMRSDGTMLVQTATADSGPGTASTMTRLAAEATAFPENKITFELGDTDYPPAPGEFGSITTASVGSAVHDVCTALKQKLIELAIAKGGDAFNNTKPEDITTENGILWPSNNSAAKISYAELLQKNGLPLIELTKESKSDPVTQTKFTMLSFGASFVEVMVHAYTGTVKVSRITSVIDNGRVINKKTASNQVLGSVAWGIGMALMEEAVMDHRYGRYVNANLSDYHVAVNADVPDTQVIFIDKPDFALDPMGAKGLGEIPLVGFAAAVGNAVYNATGKRIRELPITPDKVLG